MEHPLDIPAFLRIPQERRREAWAGRRVNGNQGQLTEISDTRGPGAVCRRAGIPDGIDWDAGRLDEAIALRRDQEARARFVAMREKAAAEKAEIEAVRERARESVSYKPKSRGNGGVPKKTQRTLTRRKGR